MLGLLRQSVVRVAILRFWYHLLCGILKVQERTKLNIGGETEFCEKIKKKVEEMQLLEEHPSSWRVEKTRHSI